jgi:AraC-like DNA-binding protein
MDYTVPPNWVLKERVIFDYELLFVKEGEVIVTVEDVDYHGIPGDMFLIKPYQKHSMRLAGDVLLRHPHIHFDLYYRPDSPSVKVSFKPLKEIASAELSWFREDVCSSPPFLIPNHIRLKNPLVAEKMMFDIIREFEQKPPYYEHSCKGIFTQLWIHLLREIYWKDNHHVLSNWEALNEVKNYLSRNLNEKIPVERLAKMANFSKSYFIRIFKNAFGMTPTKYQQLMRIEKAKELVQFTAIPLTEIAEMCGYQSIHSFSQSFKKAEGVKPSFYRRRGGNL